MKNNKISYGQENDLNLKVVITMSRATKAVHRRSSDIFKKGGLTITQFGVLEALYHKGSLSINQIIQSILSTGGNVTVVVNNLEKDQLVQRHTNPDDQRSSLISITPKGREKIEELFPLHLNDLRECFSVLSDDEKHTLTTLLQRIQNACNTEV